MKSGVLNATVQPPPCVQTNILLKGSPVIGSEDCLYLNVYRPEKLGESKLPVMVYIHAGDFIFGSSDPGVLGPTYLLEHYYNPVIVVVMQFRLSALGFLSTGDAASRGNFGLKDQRAALRWVKRYIGLFGGDDSRITVAGSSSPQLQMVSHNAAKEQLFSRVISMSGSAVAMYMFPTRDPLQLARRHAKALNISKAEHLSTEELVQEMRKMDPQQIIATVEELKEFDIYPMNIYRAVIEAEYPGSFLVEDPRRSLKYGEFLKVPILCGFVPNDGAMLVAHILADKHLQDVFNSNVTHFLQVLLEIDLDESMVEDFRKEYLRTGFVSTPEDERKLIEVGVADVQDSARDRP